MGSRCSHRHVQNLIGFRSNNWTAWGAELFVGSALLHTPFAEKITVRKSNIKLDELPKLLPHPGPRPTAQIKLPATSKKITNMEEEEARVLASLDDDASRKLRMLPELNIFLSLSLFLGLSPYLFRSSHSL